MRFYKYRTQWSSSPGKWKIVQVPDELVLKKFFNEMAWDSNWSEHFRGIQYRRISPPKEWLETQVAHLKTRANQLNSLANEYCKLIENL